jgi:hypothetical protein
LFVTHVGEGGGYGFRDPDVAEVLGAGLVAGDGFNFTATGCAWASLGPLIAVGLLIALVTRILAVARVLAPGTRLVATGARLVVALGTGLIAAVVRGVITRVGGRVGLRGSVGCALTSGLTSTTTALAGGIALAIGVRSAFALGAVALIPFGRRSLALRLVRRLTWALLAFAGRFARASTTPRTPLVGGRWGVGLRGWGLCCLWRGLAGKPGEKLLEHRFVVYHGSGGNPSSCSLNRGDVYSVYSDFSGNT